MKSLFALLAVAAFANVAAAEDTKSVEQQASAQKDAEGQAPMAAKEDAQVDGQKAAQ
jgi:hypothetical protein